MLPARNILIFHLGALGDFVVTWPLAVALGRLYPQSRIIYVTHGQKGRLAERVLGVEARDVESGRWHELFGDARALPEASARLLAGAQKVFSFIGRAEETWVDNVRRLAPRADVFSLLPRPTEPFDGHVAAFILDQLRPDPAVSASLEQILNSTADRGLGRGARGGGGVVIHPGAGSVEKCWPAERFVELAKLFRADGKTVRFVIGEVETERFDSATRRAFEAVAPLVTPADLIDLHALLRSADAFVGNDTGPAHLAGIIATPTVALFGPTSDEATWKPLGPFVKVISSKKWETLTPPQVYKQVNEGVAEAERALADTRPVQDD